MVVITHVGTRALWEEGDEWHRGLVGGVGSVCSHNTGGSCYPSPQEVNRQYHALFDCYSKGKEYWLEMIDYYLLIAVSRKPASHFLHMLQLKGQREYYTWRPSFLLSVWFFVMRCCSGAAMQQPRRFLRCRHDLSPQGSPWSLQGSSATRMGWCKIVSPCALFCSTEE